MVESATTGSGPRARRRSAELLFLAAALLSFGLSVGLWFTDSHIEALFVGLWVPSILSLGSFYFRRARGG